MGHRIVLFLSILTLCACGKNLEKQIRDQVRTVDNLGLDRSSVEVLKVEESGDFAVAEVQIKTAVKMHRQGKQWVLQEVRIGDRKWESIDRILQSLRAGRVESTNAQLGLITESIHRFVKEKGKLPESPSFEALIDTLSPEFLSTVIRLDAWSNPYLYRRIGPAEFELRSAGPDGEVDTADDLVSN